MNKIVREHYPVAKLPEDLRTAFDPGATVTLTIDQERTIAPEERHERRKTFLALIEEVRASRKTPFLSDGEAVDRIRALRDEWDDR